MVVVIDPQVAGISGDMVLCSLVDLGADEVRIINAIKKSQESLPGSYIQNIEFQRITKNGIRSVKLLLDIDETTKQRTGNVMKTSISDSVKMLDISQKARMFAVSCMDTLIQAESIIHGVPENSVHLHEASSFDTIADIVGVAVALDDLSIFDDTMVCMPISVGNDLVKFSHGIVSNPAPAILEILRDSDLTITGRQSGGESTTPTGACMLVNLPCKSTTYYPQMTVTSVGYGSGHEDFEGFANVLKIVRGDSSYISRYDAPIHHLYSMDSIVILETNVDDVSGEILGNVIEKIMNTGALDASIFPGITKKGRPTNLISVMCKRDKVNQIVDVLIAETGTLGVRISESARFVVPRTIHQIPITIDGIKFQARFKRSEFKEKNNFKIEFDDLKKISDETGRAIKEIDMLIRREIENST